MDTLLASLIPFVIHDAQIAPSLWTFSRPQSPETGKEPWGHPLECTTPTAQHEGNTGSASLDPLIDDDT